MTIRNTSAFRALMLVLLLAVGPVKAQAVFACNVMDVVVHDVCCCDEIQTLPQRDCGDNACAGVVPGDSDDPCCEHSTTLSVDEDARQNSPSARPLEFHFEDDTPDPLIVASSAIGPLYPAIACFTQRRPVHGAANPPGTGTYLLTRRLRI